jgi:hypothetical protein
MTTPNMLLDDFTSGSYIKTVLAGQTDTHYEPWPHPVPAPAPPKKWWRNTIFANTPESVGNPWAQPSTLYIHKHQGTGVLIVNTGFGSTSGLQAWYGQAPNGTPEPLGLDLSAFSAFRLNFAQGIATQEALLVNIAVNDKYTFGNEFVPAGPDPFSFDFLFSSYNKNLGLPPFDPSTIDSIAILAQGGRTASFGIASFWAVS